MGIVFAVLAIGSVFVVFSYYGRARENAGNNWTLLFATWRDSVTITLLFVAEGLLFRASEFQSLCQNYPDTLLLYFPVMA